MGHRHTHPENHHVLRQTLSASHQQARLGWRVVSDVNSLLIWWHRYGKYGKMLKVHRASYLLSHKNGSGIDIVHKTVIAKAKIGLYFRREGALPRPRCDAAQVRPVVLAVHVGEALHTSLRRIGHVLIRWCIRN